MTWEEQKKELMGEIEEQFKGKELPPALNKIQVKEVLAAAEIYYAVELKKPVEERKFYLDEYGGTVYVVQFPKKSFMEYNICEEPKRAANDNWYWRGIRLPLLLNILGNNKMPMAKVFLPEHWKPELMWEPEDEDIFVILRGNIEIKYTWTSDAKGVYGRYQNKFLKEAILKFDNPEIKSIDDILTNKQYKASLGYFDITLNPSEKLRVI